MSDTLPKLTDDSAVSIWIVGDSDEPITALPRLGLFRQYQYDADIVLH